MGHSPQPLVNNSAQSHTNSVSDNTNFGMLHSQQQHAAAGRRIAALNPRGFTEALAPDRLAKTRNESSDEALAHAAIRTSPRLGPRVQPQETVS